ncbi:hypothetical protein ABEB36_000072 [Hypothenemus hampei]|uniref:Regulatory protein zeste n=1 Tax=Hypothenemus hampei TaxID=57062 RepID=A0ABD1FDT1_HYPHA
MEGNPTQVRKNKRSRGSNFTKEEELLLLSEVQKFQNIIECKMSDKVNLSEKNEAWRKIEIGFNAKNGSHRSLEQIKIKYDNIKCKARKVVASNKKYITGTGGGPAKNNELDPVIESVLEIINKKTVVGLANLYDCDVENGSLNFAVAPGVPIENASSTSLNSVLQDVLKHYNNWENAAYFLLLNFGVIYRVAYQLCVQIGMTSNLNNSLISNGIPQFSRRHLNREPRRNLYPFSKHFSAMEMNERDVKIDPVFKGFHPLAITTFSTVATK